MPGLYDLLGGELGNVKKGFEGIINQSTANPMREKTYMNFRQQQGRMGRQARQRIKDNINPNLRGTGVTANAFNDLAEGEQNALGDVMLGLDNQDMQYQNMITGQKLSGLQGLLGVNNAQAGLMGGDRQFGLQQDQFQLDKQRFMSDMDYRKQVLAMQQGQGWGSVLGGLLKTGLNFAMPGSGAMLGGRDAFMMP